MIIKHSNILYIKDLAEIGGAETFYYEMVKKYHDLDIAVVYKTAHPNQLARLQKYCRIYKHTDENIICDVAIINYDTSIIDYITPDIYKNKAKDNQGIYQVIHGDYEHPAYQWKPPTDDRIKAYIGITKHIVESFKRITGLENVILGYNPLTIPEQKPLMLVSATRLSRIKGKDRMIKLARALDIVQIDYIWYVFTNDSKAIDSKNVIYMKPTLDVYKWLSHADYLVQLSDTEACSYSINEALYRNIPVIVTPLPYLEEIGVKHGVNAWILNFDCSNLDEIIKNIENVPKFKFKQLEDNYGNLLMPSKSRYRDKAYMKRVIALEDFPFSRFSEIENLKRANAEKNNYGVIYKDDVFNCFEDVFEYLTGRNYKKKVVVKEYENKS